MTGWWRKGPGVLGGASAALLSLAAAVGVSVGVPAVLSLEWPGWRALLRLSPVPVETLGLSWSGRAVWPAALQAEALDRMAGLVAGLFLAAVAVALLNTLVLLGESGAAQRRALAVRAAVGAGPRTLVGLLFRQVRSLLLTGLSVGLLVGMTGAAALRSAWPGETDPWAFADVAGLLLPTLLGLVATAALVYVWVGLRVGRARDLAGDLLAGGRTSADRVQAFRLRALSAVQTGLAGAVALGALALARSAPDVADPSPLSGTVLAVSVETAGAAPAWGEILHDLASTPGMTSVSMASPGALVGLGVRDNATAQCGNCYRGGLPLYLLGARADTHAVAPGYFRDVGMAVVEGRPLGDGDGPDAPRVAVINRTFANTAFEKGEPLGRMIRVGRGLDDWYQVVGVVEDRKPVVVGGDDQARAAIYVSATQHPLQAGDLLFRGTADAVASARARLDGLGLNPGDSRTLTDVAREAAAPLAWMARLSLGLGFLTLALALHGVHAIAGQVTRRRLHELAIRRVLGATSWRVVGHVLAASARTALFGAAVALFFGSGLVGLLRKAAGGVPPLGVDVYTSMAVLLVGSAVLASARAGREALAVEPVQALE